MYIKESGKHGNQKMMERKRDRPATNARHMKLHDRTKEVGSFLCLMSMAAQKLGYRNMNVGLLYCFGFCQLIYRLNRPPFFFQLIKLAIGENVC